MVSVATTLEAPIKLVFPGPGRGSMLGLGDVVLPGIMIALALRFDLFLHYLQLPSNSLPTYRRDESFKRAPYVDAASKWGERFWTWGAKDGQSTIADGARFKKVYFKASLVGYVIGLVTTLVVLNIYKHGQPALFYLVPAVLGSLWGTALFRGEFGLMWHYTEDGSLDQKDQKDEKKAAQKEVSERSKETNSTETSTDRRSLASTNTTVDGRSEAGVWYA